MSEILVRVTPNGEVMVLYDERLDLRHLGTPKIRRASHVEPDHDGNWWIDMSLMTGGAGPRFGPYRLRSEALREEVKWLQNHFL